MKAKPRKCKCMCLAQGKPIDPQLTIAEESPGCISKEPFKFLGKQIRADGSYSSARQKVQKELEVNVSKLDKTPLSGSQKYVDI